MILIKSGAIATGVITSSSSGSGNKDG